MFRFKNIKAKNFLSLGEADINLDNRGLVLIEGKNNSNPTFESNGSGKSSLMNMITYALYGQTSYGIKADDVINRVTGKNTEVILEVEIGNEPYRIERYRKHKTNKNKVRLFKGDTEITGKSAKATDEKIQELFGIDYITYMNSIVQGQGDTEVFSKATDKGKKEILENVTNIAVYKKAQEVAKEKLKNVELSKVEVEREIQTDENALTQLDTLEEQEEQSYAHTKELIEQTTQKLKEAEDYVGSLTYPQDKENHISELSTVTEPLYPEDPQEIQQLRQQLEQDRQGIVQEYAEKQELEQRTLKEEIEQEERQVEDYKSQGNQVLTQIQILENNIQQAKNTQQSLDTSTECPQCGQPIDAQHAQEEYERLNQTIKENQEKVNQTRTMYNEQFTPMVQTMETTLKEKRNQLNQRLNELETEKNQRLNDLTNTINAQIDTLKEESLKTYREEQENYNKIQKELNQLNQELQQFENHFKESERNVQRLKERLNELENYPKPPDRTEEREKIEEDIRRHQEELVACIDDMNDYEDVIKVFSNSGVRSVVLDLVTPFLNERANKYMATLSGSDIEILFTTQVENKSGGISDKFDVEIINHSGGETYKSNSEGEKKRIDMAISFAIQDLVMSKTELKTNIALYDECFEGLDEVGCENVIKLLQERQKEVGTIFVITHNSHLKALFENVITVEKVNGISHVIDE